MYKTLAEILMDIEVQKTKRFSLEEHQRKTDREKDPLLDQLLKEKQEICLQQLKDTMLRPFDRKEIEKEAKQALQEINQKIDALSLEKDSPSRFIHCKKCNDSGYIVKTGEKQFCDCVYERIYQEMYGGKAISALTGSFSTFREDIFPTKEQKERTKAAKVFTEKYVKAYPEVPKKNLILMGDAGLGKTFLLECMAKELYKKTRKILFISSFELFSAFHRNRLGVLSLLSPIYEADVVFIDDFGTEPMTANVTKEYLLHFLEERKNQKLPTIFSTNLNKLKIKERYSEKIMSRLFEESTSAVLSFEGADLRLS